MKTAIDNNLALVMASSPTSHSYVMGELFVGAGGMTLGAHRAKVKGNGFVTAWAKDIDKDACKTFDLNLTIPKKGLHCCPVDEIDFKTLQKIDGLAFGFPCNDFSVVGDRKGISGQFGGLYRWGVKALSVLQPSFFVAENVGGLASSGGKRDLKIILSALDGAGYDVYPHTYKFEEYGIPQNRHRMFIVGFRKDLKVKFEHPEGKSRKVSCKDALKDIPKAAQNNERTNQSTTVIERLKHIKPGENAFTADLPEHLKLNLKSNATISQIYKRLKPNEPSYTVTGSGGGGTHVYHWKENRALTNRERARLQTFPDSFVFSGGKESVRKQIGMAVPPKGAEVVFRAVLKTLINNNINPC